MAKRQWEKWLGSGCLLLIAACSGTQATNKSFSPAKAEELSFRWASDAISGQEFAQKAQCEDQGFEPSELMTFELDELYSVEAIPERRYYLVKFHTTLSAQDDTVEPLQEIVFITPEDYERIFGVKLPDENSGWCIHVPLS